MGMASEPFSTLWWFILDYYNYKPPCSIEHTEPSI